MLKYLAIFILIFLEFGCRSKSISNEDAENAELHHQIAISYIKSENYPLALKELQTAEKLDPNNPHILSNLGLVYFSRERYELAEKYYKKAIAVKTDFSEAKNNLARIYIELGNYRSAEPLLNNVLDDLTYADYNKAQFNYGLLKFKTKKYDEAISFFKKTIDKDRENCFANVYLGRSYLELKQVDQAATLLEKTTRFCKEINNDLGHYYSAIALYRNGEKQKAKFRFDELTKLFPKGKNFEKATQMIEIIDKETN